MLFFVLWLEVCWYVGEVIQIIFVGFKQMYVWIVKVQFVVYFVLEFVLCLWGVLVWCLGKWYL